MPNFGGVESLGGISRSESPIFRYTGVSLFDKSTAEK
jgi:hypothetical protein